MNEIYCLIHKIGGNAKYVGYHFTAEAVQIMLSQPEVPLKITKDIYPVVADNHTATTDGIEHGIRTIAEVCWNRNRKAMEEVAGCTLPGRPSNKEFIGYLFSYLYTQSGR